MTTVLLMSAAATIAAIIVIRATRFGVPATPVRPAHSPLEQAERILASRYARRQISADEYERTLQVLRR